ncbi:MAG: cytoplasmic protein [Sandaracinus sp.]|nr:cytoplasmic protein [Sandaracinus sp.]|tara:strand:- start:422 stop:676 length:255 start_codon:yes stop_codon:yes gene_type:complete
MTSAEPEVVRAHSHSIDHRAEILASALCGCFHCLATFPPTAIDTWVDRGETAMCPRCGIDAVLGSAAGFSLDRQFLGHMRRRWF